MLIKLAIAGTVLFGALFSFQDAQDDKKPNGEMQKMMELYQKAATPGEQHRALAKMEGKWEQNGQCPMGTITGTVEYKSILGGRFIMADGVMKMTPTGHDPMESQTHQIIGYDNVTKQYQTTWLDSMGTGIYFSSGTADVAGTTITYEAPTKDALTPQGRPFKVVVKKESDDKHTIEIWDSKKDGKTLQKEATITETRVK
jgi:hypothetical protein